MTKIAPRTATTILWQGDDLARIQELEEAVYSAVSRAGPRLMHEGDPKLAAAREHDEFVTAAKVRAVVVTLQALGRKKWGALVAAHPPRDDDEQDMAFRFNTETMADPLVSASLRSATAPDPAYTPDLSTDEGREEFLDSLSDGDFGRLYKDAIVLNRGASPDPKADLYSRLARTSDET